MRPHILVIFGGTGDLTKRKLAPAFARLVKHGKMHPDSAIVGVGRRAFTDKQYHEAVIGHLQKDMHKINLFYYQADFSRPGDLNGLEGFLREKEGHNKCDRMYYLATHYKYFIPITNQLAEHGLHRSQHGFRRVLYEKPFGDSMESSQEIIKEIHKVFPEEEIYRIDHYLGKETVQNILTLRFSNPLFEAVWNYKYIDRVRIFVSESIGVEERMEFYSGTGAVKDMIQNHLLQVASLVLMEPPDNLEVSSIHDRKVELLGKLQVTDVKAAKYQGLPESFDIETYAKATLSCRNARWRGTPIILETGKKLKESIGYIEIVFKKTPCYLHCEIHGVKPNRLIIHIQPVQDIVFELNTRNPKKHDEIGPVKMEFCYACAFGPNSVDAYEKLLEDCVNGDKTLFTRYDELIECWKITDEIIRRKGKISTYKGGWVSGEA